MCETCNTAADERDRQLETQYDIYVLRKKHIYREYERIRASCPELAGGVK